MRSVIFGTLLLLVAVGALAACGNGQSKGQSDAERSYAEACVKIWGGGGMSRARCDCEAAIIVPKLTTGELKAYVASPDLKGKALTSEDYSKLGFTSEEMMGAARKWGEAQGQISKTCAGK